MSPGMALKVYAATAAVFFAVDLVWLGVVASGFYRRHLGHLLREDVLWPAALLFYAIYLVGVVAFAVAPAVDAGSVARAALLGALLGLVAYAAFDLTCLALFEDFPVVVVVVDLVWGMVLTAGVASAGYGFARWFGAA